MINYDKVKPFVNAILDIARDENNYQTIYKEAKLINAILEENPELITLIDNVSFETKEKTKIIDKAFKEFHYSLLNSMQILAQKSQFKLIVPISKLLLNELSLILKIKDAYIYSPQKINASELKRIKEKLEKQFDSKIVLHNFIDKELIGGFKIILNDNVIENSAKQDLEKIKNHLLKNGGI